jgi:hypothetical protein
MKLAHVLAVTVAVAAVVFWLLRDLDGGPKQVAQPAGIEEIGKPRETDHALPLQQEEAVEEASSHAAPTSDVEPAAPLGRVILEGVLEGGGEAHFEGLPTLGAQLQGAGCVRSSVGELSRAGEFQFDITQLFDVAGCSPERLRVQASTWEHRSTRTLDVSSIPERRRTEREVRLSVALPPLSRFVVRGTVVGADSRVRGSVQAFGEPIVNGVPRENWGREVRIQADGRFELPLRTGGRIEVIARAAGHAPWRRVLELAEDESFDLGTIALDRGLELRGRVEPNIEGAALVAQCVDSARMWGEFAPGATQERSSDETLAILGASARLGRSGEFALSGLMPTRYRLSLQNVPGVGDLDLDSYLAPATDLLVALPLGEVRLKLARRGGSAARVRFDIGRPDPRGGYFTRRALFTDAAGAATFWAVAGEPHELVVGENVRTFLAPARGEVLELALDL